MSRISDRRYEQMSVRGITFLRVERILAESVIPLSSEEIWRMLGYKKERPNVTQHTFYRWLRQWGNQKRLYVSVKRRGYFTQHFFLDRPYALRQLSYLED